MSDPSDEKIVEEREEYMISPTGGKTTLRLAHILTPSVSSGESLLLLSSSSLSSSSDFHVGDSKKESKSYNLKIFFPGWRYPLEDWKTWTDRMHSLHRSVWKEAGICDAVLNSTYKIHRNDELIFGFVEKWCPDTNTFVFPWGEATITLEDVMILGGYSVLGDPVFSPIESSELEQVEKKLLSARSEIVKTKVKRASQRLWLCNLMDSGSEIEHEAFLALWLSRFVFPSKSLDARIERYVLPAAIHLSRGSKMALAPAVLANLYANLSEMKGALNTTSNEKDCTSRLLVSAPFQLVQIWVWERFSSLRPIPRTFEHDHPRFTKWDSLRIKSVGIGNVKLAIDEAADYFHWRPYTMGCKGSFSSCTYKEEARWVPVGSDIDEELEILVRCLRVSELVGTDSDCIEQYLPHRVAMQFGFDQDVPGYVSRFDSNQSMAWENYSRKIGDQRLYIPPRLFEPDVTTRYIAWWKKRISAWSNDPINTNVHGVNSKRSKKTRLLSSLTREISKVRECSSLKRRFGKGVSSSSAGRNSHIGSVISSRLQGKQKSSGTGIYGHLGAKRLGDGNHVEDRAKKRARLTGSLYKKALANLLNSKSLGERVSLSSSESNLKIDALVPPGFHPKHSGSGSASGGSETESFCHQAQIPSSGILTKVVNEAVAERSGKFNSNARNGKNCSSYALVMELEARITNLERIIAEHERKHAPAADDNEDCE